MTILLSGSH